MIYAPTSIDVSRLTAPDAIEVVSFDDLVAAGKTRFLSEWADQQRVDTSLSDFTEQDLATHPLIVGLRTFAYVRGLDRQRVNDALSALLAPLAAGSNLDTLVASRNVERMTISAATATQAAVMESDVSLLRRYLLSFDKPSAGSSGRYLYDAWTAWPQSTDKTLGLWDARVNGWAVHGRRGDTDVVVIGPYGRLPTADELNTIRKAVTDPNRAPEAVAISVMAATRAEYAASLVIEIPGVGPSADAVKAEAINRVTTAATNRVLVGGEIPDGLLAGAAYGDGVIRVRDLSPVVIAADPYAVPVMTRLSVAVEVR
jgi:phage-related baseplate assembly protein